MSEVAPIPVQSRREVNAMMSSRGLRTAAELAAGKPCGTRIRYFAGCRCGACRQANSAYERERQLARQAGEWNGLVSAARARAHLVWLSTHHHIGYKTAADSAGVSASVAARIVDGSKLKIRAQTERCLLAVTELAAADGARADAGATWVMLDELIACGYSKAALASALLGRKARSLQISRRQVEVRTAGHVRTLYERLRYATPADTRQAQALVAELRAEGFRLDRIKREMATLAASRGLPEPTLDPAVKGQRKGCIRHFEIQLIEAVHAALVGEPA